MRGRSGAARAGRGARCRYVAPDIDGASPARGIEYPAPERSHLRPFRMMRRVDEVVREIVEPCDVGELHEPAVRELAAHNRSRQQPGALPGDDGLQRR